MVDPVAVGDLNSTEPGTGARRCGGKTEFSQIPLHVLAGAAQVGMLGAVKYADYNYARGMKWSICFNCALRHLFKWFYSRSDRDEDTLLHHLDHAIWNLIVLRHYTLSYSPGDDRPSATSLFEKSMSLMDCRTDVEEFKTRTGYGTTNA